MYLFEILLVLGVLVCARAWVLTDDGYATMTHYDLPKDAIAACGCTAESDHYPTAAMSALAYNGSDSTGYGASCGRCFKLQLINSILSDPPWFPENPPSLVVKITDKCPDGPPWCNATDNSPNAGGHWVNFDLAWPSDNGAIPDDFFPTNESYYGYTDMGVWNISYTTVSCADEWAGAKNPAAIGSVPSVGDGACCPLDPIADPSTVCPSTADTAPPNTNSTGGGSGGPQPPGVAIGQCSLVPLPGHHKGSPLAVIILLCFTVTAAVLVHGFLRISS